MGGKRLQKQFSFKSKEQYEEFVSLANELGYEHQGQPNASGLMQAIAEREVLLIPLEQVAALEKLHRKFESGHSGALEFIQAIASGSILLFPSRPALGAELQQIFIEAVLALSDRQQVLATKKLVAWLLAEPELRQEYRELLSASFKPLLSPWLDDLEEVPVAVQLASGGAECDRPNAAHAEIAHGLHDPSGVVLPVEGLLSARRRESPEDDCGRCVDDALEP